MTRCKFIYNEYTLLYSCQCSSQIFKHIYFSKYNQFQNVFLELTFISSFDEKLANSVETLSFEDLKERFTVIVSRRTTICWYLLDIILHSVTRQCPSLDTAAILWEFAAWRHLVLHCAEEAGKSPVMVVRGLEVGIKPSLSACSVPLIRWLASAMQWTRWKVFDWQN